MSVLAITSIALISFLTASTGVVLYLVRKAPLIEEVDPIELEGIARHQGDEPLPSPHHRVPKRTVSGSVFFVPHQRQTEPAGSHVRLPR